MKILLLLLALFHFTGNTGFTDVNDTIKARNELGELEVEQRTNVQDIEIMIKTNKSRTMTVEHEVKEQDIYVECKINDFTFTKERAGHTHKDGEGHLQLFIDGQKVDDLFQPSFIIKGLPSGEHIIKLVLVRNDREPYGVEEEFSVQVP